MVSLKSPLFKLSLLFSLPLVSFTGFSTLIQTSSAIARGIPERWQANEYQPPADIGTLGRRDTGGTRGDTARCPVSQVQALTPANSFAVTVAPYPTLFFYMPRQSPQAPSAQVEFVLHDDQEIDIYKSTFKMTEKSNLVSISVPPNAGLPPLEVGRDYRWSLTVICNPEDREKDLVVYGLIRRVPLKANLSNQLMQALPEERASLYAESSIWQDALTALVQLRRSNPNNPVVAEQWRKLLTSVGLKEVAKETF